MPAVDGPARGASAAPEGAEGAEGARGERRAAGVSAVESVGPRKRRLSLPLERVELLRLIGDGAFGRVHLSRVYFGAEGVAAKFCALKSMSKTQVIFKGKAAQVAEECRILNRVHTHPFILTQLKAFQTSTHLHLMTELAVNGDLYSHLRKRGRFAEATARFYAAEVLLALEHCHERGIVYRDLKPENVLLCGRGHVRLADFGLAVDMNERHEGDEGVAKLYTLCGSDDYVAPDVLRGHGYGPEVDLWALGCLTYELLTGCAPFHERTLPQVEEMAQKIRARESLVKTTWPQEPPGSECNAKEPVPSSRHSTFTRILMETPMLPAQLSRDSKEFIKGLLQKTPSKRVGFAAAQRAVLSAAEMARTMEGGPAQSESEDGVASPCLSSPDSIFASNGAYDACVKQCDFFAPLGAVVLDELIDGVGPLPHKDRGVRKAVSSFIQRFRARRSDSSGSEDDEDGIPSLRYLPKHVEKQLAGLPVELCAESGMMKNASPLNTEKLSVLRELGNSIFSQYPVAADSVVHLPGPPSPSSSASN
mmetsp:Transcript_11638/g.43383  ORF Transcript_11638/g.43383 Transcript_11638/m.43383 type:complete len:535 (-) Transcript_11638:259-1863(-)|eukprot:scaffold149_cov315-Pinguiococcus_pyrenoidosus.AAC.159